MGGEEGDRLRQDSDLTDNESTPATLVVAGVLLALTGDAAVVRARRSSACQASSSLHFSTPSEALAP